MRIPLHALLSVPSSVPLSERAPWVVSIINNIPVGYIAPMRIYSFNKNACHDGNIGSIEIVFECDALFPLKA